MVKPRDEEIDLAVYRATNGLTDKQIELLKEKSETVWFRQAARKSKTVMHGLLRKVKKGIKDGDYDYGKGARHPDEDKRGQMRKHLKPKIKKGKKKVKESKKKIIKAPIKKITRKEKEKIKQMKYQSPKGRKYSAYEIHEGVNSKRSIAYREKHGIKK